MPPAGRRARAGEAAAESVGGGLAKIDRKKVVKGLDKRDRRAYDAVSVEETQQTHRRTTMLPAKRKAIRNLLHQSEDVEYNMGACVGSDRDPITGACVKLARLALDSALNEGTPFERVYREEVEAAFQAWKAATA